MRELIISELNEAIRTEEQLVKLLVDDIERAAQAVLKSVRRGGKVVIFGNGGSASQAQHFAAELLGRFERDRAPLAALALTADTSTLTAIANDYGFRSLFSRQVEALVDGKDVVVAMSTSGTSPNVLEGILAAKRAGAVTVALLGNEGGEAKGLVDVALVVPSPAPSRIQEGHMTIIHIICKIVEEVLFGKKVGG